MATERARLFAAIERVNGRMESARAREVLARLGWSYRAAAPLLGVHFTHLCLVLNGHRQSRRLLSRIQTLPRREA